MMRVDDRSLNGAGGLQTTPTPGSQRTDGGGSTLGAQISESQSGDRVEISGTAGSVSQALGTGSAQRAQYIQKLTADYQSGNYTVNSLATSRAMIQDALDRKDGAQ
jgi:Anti-sigma-28 factor, FlgM